ncbi:MAG: sporulation protein [Clostridiales bacterium]|nr:sporulation protein [Clostridiales bacterium]
MGERLARGLDLPLEAVSLLPKLELVGNRALYVEGHRGILEYSDTVVRMSGGALVIVVAGSGLELLDMTASSARVVGRIVRISLEE